MLELWQNDMCTSSLQKIVAERDYVYFKNIWHDKEDSGLKAWVKNFLQHRTWFEHIICHLDCLHFSFCQYLPFGLNLLFVFHCQSFVIFCCWCWFISFVENLWVHNWQEKHPRCQTCSPTFITFWNESVYLYLSHC